MNNEMLNNLHFLDKAIIENNGRWPSLDGEFLKVSGPKNTTHTPLFVFDFGCLNSESNDYWVFICTKDQFNQRAKELGFINGYRWGVEYPTNGKRPALPDDVMVKVAGKFIKGNWYSFNYKVNSVDWLDSVLFKITDQRYRPQDTSYLNSSSQDQGLTHKSADETIQCNTSEWYDYENQKALRLPDVGTECYRKVGINLLKTSIVAHHHDGVRAIFCDEGFSIGELGYCAAVSFKPLDHATRKAELEKKRVVDAVYQWGLSHGYDQSKEELQGYYDAGYLRLPANKD